MLARASKLATDFVRTHQTAGSSQLPKQSETDPASSLERAAKKFATLKYGRTETHFRDTNFYVLAQAENTEIRLTL